MATRLEHANVCVSDMDAMIRFLETAFPEFHVRGEGISNDGTRWVHVGTDETYIALGQSRVEPQKRWTPYQGVPGVNHLAYEVDDVEALRKRMTGAGYRDSTVPNAHPFRKRVYFYDPEGNDWEFVQYLSEEPAKRNDYELPELIEGPRSGSLRLDYVLTGGRLRGEYPSVPRCWRKLAITLTPPADLTEVGRARPCDLRTSRPRRRVTQRRIH